MSNPEDRKAAPDEPQRISSQDARGAEIILRSRSRKIIFFGGLIAFVVLVFVLGLIQLAGA